MNHCCEECGAVLDPTKVLRCAKCQACRYCSRECQIKNWKLHKRVCSTDPRLQPFMRVEMAVERALAKLPKTKAPKEARCYICLDGDRKSSKLMRGCACRGESAGFVHLECLEDHAMSKEESGSPQSMQDAWLRCMNCKHNFEGALGLDMRRRFWRSFRRVDQVVTMPIPPEIHSLCFTSMRYLASSLSRKNETDAATHLYDTASKHMGNDMTAHLEMELHKISMLEKNGHKLEALERLKAMAPEAKAHTTDSGPYVQTMTNLAGLLSDLDRHKESLHVSTDVVAFCEAKYGREHPYTLYTKFGHAMTFVELGPVEESKAMFDDLLTLQTRVLGRDHEMTNATRIYMQHSGFTLPPIV